MGSGSSKGIRAGRAFVELGVDDKIAKGLQRAEQRLKAFGEGVRSVGLKLGGLGAAALTMFGGAVKSFVETGDALDEMSARTGVSVETLSELGWAADLAGADLDTLETGLRKMQKTVTEAAQGSQSAGDALAQLGLTVGDLVHLSPEQQFKLIADRLSQIADPTRRAALAMEVFGKSGTRLLPLIADGAKGLEEYQRKARELGLTVSTETAKDAAALADTLDTLWRVLKHSAFTIGAALAPTIKELGDAVTRVVVRVTEWLRQNKAIIVTALQVAAVVTAVGLGLVAAGTLISGIGAVCGLAASAITGIGTVLGALGAALAAIISPVGLVITAIVGLGATLLVVSGAGQQALAWLGEQFGMLWDTVQQTVGGVADALAAGDLTLAAQVLWAGLKLVWEQGANALLQVWLALKGKFLNVLGDFVYGGQALWVEFTAGVQALWAHLLSYLRSSWAQFSAWHARAVEASANWIAKRWLEVQGVFDPTLNVQAAKESVDEQSDQRWGEIATQEQTDLAGIEQDRQKALSEAAQRRDKRLLGIGQQDVEAQRRLQEVNDARLRASQGELDQARQDLAEARAKAAEARKQMEGRAAPTGVRPDPLAGLDDQLAGLGDALARKLTITGTFNAMGVHGLGSGDAAERTARASEQTARNTKRLAEKPHAVFT